MKRNSNSLLIVNLLSPEPVAAPAPRTSVLRFLSLILSLRQRVGDKEEEVVKASSSRKKVRNALFLTSLGEQISAGFPDILKRVKVCIWTSSRLTESLSAAGKPRNDAGI